MYREYKSKLNVATFKKVMYILEVIKNLRNMKSVKKQKRKFCENFREFCEDTSLHGLKFVGNNEISFVERAFFGIAFVLGFIISIIYICKIYEKWNTTPILIGINPIPTSISDIPFPAVTICNMNQARLSKVKDLNNNSVDYAILQTLCHREEQLENIPQTRDYRKYESFILNVSQPCGDMFISCEFGTLQEHCSEIFRETITDEGLCCAFNTLGIEHLYKRYKHITIVNKTVLSKHKYKSYDWSPEKGYSSKDFPRYYYPRVAAGVGSNMGLSIVLNAQMREYYCSSTSGAGFKVFLHNPAEAPNIGSLGISVKVGAETRIAITPKLSVASSALKSMKLKNRRCIFSDESKLHIYATYSQRNCQMECESRVLVKECNCTSYYMPRISPNIYVCGLDDRECVENVTVRAKRLYANDTIDCSRRCIPPCFSLSYETDSYSIPIGQGHDYMLRSPEVCSMDREFIKDNIAIMHFYYKEKLFRSSTKEMYIGFTDFLSNTGGIVGLFLGSSFISLIEILYYTTLRPIYMRRRYKMTHKESLRKNNKTMSHDGETYRRNVDFVNNHYCGRKSYGFNCKISSEDKIIAKEVNNYLKSKNLYLNPSNLPYID